MRLRILLVALISTTVAQQRSSRAPQAQIKYHDPNGLKVDWKFFAPQNQWQSHLQNSQPQQQEASQPQQSGLKQSHAQSQLVQIEPDHLQHRSYPRQQAQPESQADPGQSEYKNFVQPQSAEVPPNSNQIQYKVYPQPQVPVEAQPDPNQIHYNSYAIAPSHVKQVVLENFKPQRPYVDPSAFLYNAHGDFQQFEQQAPQNSDLVQYEQPSEGNEQPEQQKTRREYSDRGLQGKIIYKEEYDRLVQQQHEQLQQQHHQLQQQHQQQLQQQHQQQQQQESQVQHVPVPVERLPLQPPQKLLFDKSMPSEIQELLHYQAQIPYDVIANSITYKPKSLFVPKPLPSESKGPYSYRSKVYYVNEDEYQPDFESTKPVDEERRH